MSKSAIAACAAGVLLAALFAHGATRNNTVRIKVLDSETHTVAISGSDVAKNCDQLNYDAYCHSSKTEEVTNTLLVQEDDGTRLRITCTVDSKWSRCVPLPKGQSFEAKREKRGITVYYVDDKGKARGQLYTLVAGGGSAPPAGTRTTQPGKAAAGSATQEPAANSESTPPVDVATESSSREAVKCNFTSTPSGAEVILDGQYVGSTPSVLGLTPGTHVVALSLPGFVPWKRDLAVTPGSELTVNAVLQKVP